MPSIQRNFLIATGLAVIALALGAAPKKVSTPPLDTAKPTAATSGPNQAAAPTIRGRVAASDGKPVKKAVVRLVQDAQPRETRRRTPAPSVPPATRVETGDDGTFQAAPPTAGPFVVRVEATGWAPFTQTGVAAGASLRVVLKKGYSIVGSVRDQASRDVVAGATVLACDADATRFGDEACRSAKSGDDGKFTLADVARGSVRLEARAKGHAAARLEQVAIPPTPPKKDEPPAPIELWLAPGARLAGRTVGADGKAIEGASLVATPLDLKIEQLLRGSGSTTVTSDPSGGFAFEGLPVGRYRIRASAADLAAVESGPFDVRAGIDRTDLEIRLDAGATLRVRVVDPEGNPVHGLSLELNPAEGRGRRRGGARFGGNEIDAEQIHEADDGKYSVTRLEAGTYTVRLLPDDREEVEKEDVRLESGETVDLGTIVAREGRSVSGHVTDTSTAPIAGAEVSALWSTGAGMKNRRGRTKADGRYRIAGVGEEPITMLIVEAKGFARADKQSVAPGDTAADFVLEHMGSVVGRVVAPGGGAPAAFRVTAHAEAKRGGEGMGGMFRMLANNDGGSQVFSDPTGNFRLDDIEPGSYTIEGVAEPFAPARKTGVHVEAEQVADAGTLTLREGVALRGRVLDAKDDAPVAGASVRVETPSVLPFQGARSDPAGSVMSATDGAFAVLGLDTGAYVVTVEHPEFSASRVRVEIPADQDPAEVVAHLSRGGVLSGTVRDAQRQPLADVSIVVFQGMGQDMRTAATGADGSYSFDRLAPGSYQAMKAPDGRGRLAGFGSKNAVIREGETTVVDFDDAPKVRLHGTVRRGDEPLSGVTLIFGVSPSGPAGGDIHTAQSDSEGHYETGLDHGGTYEVSVQELTPGRFRAGRSVRVQVPESPEASVDIVVSALGISGRVTNADGKPVVGAIVTARIGAAATGDAGGQTAAVSEGDGAFRLDGLDPGTYRVSGRADGYRSSEPITVVVAEGGQPAPIDLRLERGRALRGRVVDPGGRGLAEAMVLVAPAGSSEGLAGSAMTRADFNGTFELTAPSEGPMDITAIPAGWAPVRLEGVTPATSDDAPELVLRAGLGGKLRVRVAGPEGQPVAGAQVTIRPTPPWPGSGMAIGMRRFPPTGTDGATSLDLLAPGVYSVSLVGRADVAPVSIAVSEGSEATASVVLPK